MKDNNCIFFIDNLDKYPGNKNPFIDSTPNQDNVENDKDQRIERIEQKDVSQGAHYFTPVKNSRSFLFCCCNKKDTV